MPGVIESHGHFMGLGRSLAELDLRRAHSWDDIVAMVREAANTARPGEWIVGRGWHQEKWDRPPEPNVDGLPYNTSLSAASPNNPVLLEHASGHGAYGNAKAFELAAQDAIRKALISFQDQGESFRTIAIIANGTDAPVEDEDLIPNFACSVSRILRDGSAFFPGQSVTRMQALRSYTLDPAYTEFMEHDKGSLTPAKLADVVVLSRDIMTVPVAEIPQARVLYTIIGGKVAYQAGGQPGSPSQ